MATRKKQSAPRKSRTLQERFDDLKSKVDRAAQQKTLRTEIEQRKQQLRDMRKK